MDAKHPAGLNRYKQFCGLNMSVSIPASSYHYHELKMTIINMLNPELWRFSNDKGWSYPTDLYGCGFNKAEALQAPERIMH